jgi:hypothetical protein
MRRWLTTLGLAVSCAVAARAQTIEATMAAANAAESAGKFVEAARLFERGYGLTGFDPSLFAIAAISAAHGGADSLAVADLGRAIREGFLDPNFLRYAETDSSLARIRRNAQWRAVLDDAKRRVSALNQPLRRELLELAERDQQNRAHVAEVIGHYGSKSPQSDSVLRALAGSDAPLIARVREIVATHGWPGRSLVADDGAHAAWLIVQHASAEVQRQLLPTIRRAIERGEGRLGDLALLEDRVLVADGQPQRYGTQLSYPPMGGAPMLDTLLDPSCVDLRRASVGLEPLAEYLKRMGAAYSPPPPCHSGDQHVRPPAERPPHTDHGRHGHRVRVVVHSARRAAAGPRRQA